MPRYYKNKIYNEHERKAIGVQARLAMIERRYVDLHVKQGWPIRVFPDGSWDVADYHWSHAERAENDLGAFKKMYKNALIGRDKIFL